MPKTESQETQDLIKDLKERRPEWVIIKHSDRFNKGIPDLSISHDRRTLWLERKRLKPNQRLDKPCQWVDNLVQLETLVKLNGWYHVHDPNIGRTLIVKAEVIRPMVIEKNAFASAYYRPDDTVMDELELLILQYLGGEDVSI